MLTTRYEDNEKNRAWNEKVNAMLKELDCGYPAEVARKILDNPELEDVQKVAILVKYCDILFGKMRDINNTEAAREFRDSYRWEEITAVMDMLEDFKNSIDWNPYYDYYQIEINEINTDSMVCNYSLWYNRLFLAIAIRSDEMFNKYAQEGITLMKYDMAGIKDIYTYSFDIVSFKSVIKACKCFEACYLMVPYLIGAEREAEIACHYIYEEKGYLADANYVQSHMEIVECAELALKYLDPFVIEDWENFEKETKEILKWIENRFVVLKKEVEDLGEYFTCMSSALSSNLCHVYESRYNGSDDKLTVMKSIMQSNLILSEKENMINWLISKHFALYENVYGFNNYYLCQTTDWKMMEVILDMEEKMLDTVEKADVRQYFPHMMDVYKKRNMFRRQITESKLCECLDFEIEEIEIPYDVPVVEEMDII